MNEAIRHGAPVQLYEAVPAVASVQCPQAGCETYYQVEIKVTYMCVVDDHGSQKVVPKITGVNNQDAFDHMLFAHGPRMD